MVDTLRRFGTISYDSQYWAFLHFVENFPNISSSRRRASRVPLSTMPPHLQSPSSASGRSLPPPPPRLSLPLTRRPSSLASTHGRYLHTPFMYSFDGPVIALGPGSVQPVRALPSGVSFFPSWSMMLWLSCWMQRLIPRPPYQIHMYGILATRVELYSEKSPDVSWTLSDELV